MTVDEIRKWGSAEAASARNDSSSRAGGRETRSLISEATRQSNFESIDAFEDRFIYAESQVAAASKRGIFRASAKRGGQLPSCHREA